MRYWAFFLPVGCLVAFAAYLGLRAGQVPTETEIINRYAAAYVAEVGDGAAVTDCAATPHPHDAIRMVVVCQPAQGDPMTFLVGPRGGLVSEGEGGIGA